MKTLDRNTKAMLSVVAFVLMVAGLARCHSDPEPSGSTEQRTISAMGATTVQPNSNEPTVAFSPVTGGIGNPLFVAAYNNYDPAPGDSGLTWSLGWATSTNGTTWGIKNPASAPTIPGHVTWKGNSSVATDGIGNAILVTMVDDQGDNNTHRIAALISSNGGTAFQAVQTVNDTGNCSDGQQDQPRITFDITTSPATLWVAWRHKGSGSYGGCVRGGTLVLPTDGGTTPSIQWFSEPKTIDNMTGSTGQGGIQIQAGDGAITVVYMNNDDVPGGNGFTCPDFGQKSVGWGVVQSFNKGEDWTDSYESVRTDHFVWCVGTGSGVSGRAFQDFSFVRAPSGDMFVAINDTKNTIRLYHFRGGDPHYIWREDCGTGSGNCQRV